MAEPSIPPIEKWEAIVFDEQPEETEDTDESSVFSLEVPLVVDNLKAQQLGSSEYRNTKRKEQHEPRQMVAAYDSRHFYFHITSSRARYGLYKSEPACLVVFSFSFQKKGSTWSRFRTAEIDIEFSDAPIDGSTRQVDGLDGLEAHSDDDDDELQPTVLDFEPRLFYGPVDVGKGKTRAGAKLALVPPGSLGSLGVEFEKEWPVLEKGYFKAHGTTRDNPPSRLHLSLSENGLSKGGIRPEMSAALIVKYVPGRRFSARVTVKADMFLNPWPTPVCGEKDDPIYFDPDFTTSSKDGAEPKDGVVQGVKDNTLDNANLLQKLTRLGQYGGVFIRQSDD